MQLRRQRTQHKASDRAKAKIIGFVRCRIASQVFDDPSVASREFARASPGLKSSPHFVDCCVFSVYVYEVKKQLKTHNNRLVKYLSAYKRTCLLLQQHLLVVGGLHGVGHVGQGRQGHGGRLRRVPRVDKELRDALLLLLLLLPEHVVGGVAAVARTAER